MNRVSWMKKHEKENAKDGRVKTGDIKARGTHTIETSKQPSGEQTEKSAILLNTIIYIYICVYVYRERERATSHETPAVRLTRSQHEIMAPRKETIHFFKRRPRFFY